MTSTQAKVNQTIIELVKGDITNQAVDAIVNAANNSLLGGGGVDGAIHQAAGPALLQETRTLGGCNTGDAKISGGYNLPAKHVIHTVGPIYQASNDEVARLLTSAYRRSLEVALENEIRTIAFPSISTGVYGYPVNEAAEISLKTTFDFLRSGDSGITLVRFVLFSEDALAAFSTALQQLHDA